MMDVTVQEDGRDLILVTGNDEYRVFDGRVRRAESEVSAREVATR